MKLLKTSFKTHPKLFSLMIYLQIKHFTQKQNLYCVTLGNGTSFEFKSEKACQKFLVKTSKFLTKCFNELNVYFGQAFNLYRQNYFYFDNNRKKRHAQLYENRRIVNSEISGIEKTFENLSFVSFSANGNQAAFHQLQNISDSLIQIVIICKSVNESKSFASFDIYSDVLIKNILEVKQALTQYSICESISFESMPPSQHQVSTMFQLHKVS
jgi:hypothetical protein